VKRKIKKIDEVRKIVTNSDDVLKWIEEHGMIATMRSEVFGKIEEKNIKCPKCGVRLYIPFLVPEEGERGCCVFCDCPADIMLCVWLDEYKRYGKTRRGWIRIPLCEECLKHYLKDEAYLDFRSLTTDSGAV